MKRPVTGRVWTSVLFLVAAGTAQPAAAQLAGLKGRLHGGIVQPLASTGDYFKFGPSVGVDVAYPLTERLDIGVDFDWDYLNTTDIYPTPTSNLWHYGLGVEGDLLGDPGDATFILKALAGAGATTIRSHEFWLNSRRPYTFEGETINQTSLTATGGLRLGLRTSDGITWWLTGKVNWLPIQDTNANALKELARNQLDPLGSALNASITLGVTLW
ncbi:MAG: hypothetical protein EXR95_01385 [Gemmatimonadetes bacterium]|nr:hypothetical protein [Gemmatimonadota bacterium]